MAHKIKIIKIGTRTKINFVCDKNYESIKILMSINFFFFERDFNFFS